MGNFKMLIGGVLVEGAETMDVINPATKAVIAQAPDCTEAELDQAVSAARGAFPKWSAKPIDERKSALRDLADAIETHLDEFAALLVAEQGKPRLAAERDILNGLTWLRETAELQLPETVVLDDAERRTVIQRVPLGVVAGLVPWNLPVYLAMLKVAPALVAGNTMVLKPSPTTPLVTLRIGELAAQVLPPGVLNIISGGDRLGPWVTAHPGIDKITFTGSIAVGKAVLANAKERLARVSLELGGNDAAIVLADVDPDKTADSLFQAAFYNTGQICIAPKRIYVHDAVYDRLRDALADRAAKAKVGNGAEPDTQLGPIQNRRQYERVTGLIERAHNAGLTFAYAGGIPDDAGFFVMPHIIDNPPEEAEIVQVEQFGPVVPLLRYTDIDDVVARANASAMGLGASIWSADTAAAAELAARLDVGTVWINNVFYINPMAPFSGAKQSGFGAEGGIEGFHEFTRTRTVHILHSHPNA